MERSILGTAGWPVFVDDLARVREEPGPVALTLFITLVAGLLIGIVFLGGDSKSKTQPNKMPVTGATAAAETAQGQQAGEKLVIPGQSQATQRAFEAALTEGVAVAEKQYGGRATAAIWPVEWESPIVVKGNAPAEARMWSMSKPVTAIAALRAFERKNQKPTLAFRKSMRDAITMSGNCGARRMALSLQTNSGTESAAKEAFRKVLTDANTDVSVAGVQSKLTQADVASCKKYLSEIAPIEVPSESALQFGTVNWSVAEAVGFMRELSAKSGGGYGTAGRTVLRLMGQPKQSVPATYGESEQGARKYPNWGAGESLTKWKPAYKAGWGGSNQNAFVAGQIVLLRGVNPPVAIAAMFHPNAQPPNDDPEQTKSREALNEIFNRISTQLDSMRYAK